MTNPEESLSPKQLRVLQLLMDGQNITQISNETGLCQKTIQRWLQDPKFKNSLRFAVTEVYERVIADCVRGSLLATRNLIEIVEGEDSTRRDKIAASRELLANAARWLDLNNIELAIQLCRSYGYAVIDSRAVELAHQESSYVKNCEGNIDE